MGALSRTSLFSRWIGHFVDGAFWVIDEIVRWWEIAKISRSTKKLRKQRNEILEKNGLSESFEGHSAQREKLVNISEEISRLTSQEESLRRRSWALTPELILAGIVIVFIFGLFWIKPRNDAMVISAPQTMDFRWPIFQQSEIQFSRNSIVTSAVWFDGKLFIGGDGGLFFLDPILGIASFVANLPKDFFVRHLLVENNRLLIAGFGGVFSLDRTGGILPLYEKNQIPGSLINRIAVVKNGHLLGTLGQGLLKGRRGLAVIVLGTTQLAINGFAWLEGELWLLHERGLMRGDGSNFVSVNIPVFEGKKLSSIAATSQVLFVGTNDGVVAAYRNNQGWVWTPLPPNGPKNVRDLAVSGNTLLICADDGLYRFESGNFEKLSSKTGQQTFAVGPDYVATVGPDKIILYRFSQTGTASAVIASSFIPTVGTFVQNISISASQTIQSNPLPAVSQPISTLGQVANQPSVVGGSSAIAPIPILDSVLPRELSGPNVTSILGDSRRLFVGTSNAGLWVLEGGSWKTFSRSNGQLPDDQIVALWNLQGKPFLFGWINGLMSLDTGKPVSFLSAELSKGLISVSGDQNAPIALFEGGFLRRIRNGTLELVAQIPDSFAKIARSVQVINNSIFVVTDQGILSQKPDGEWNLSWFPIDSSGKTKFAAAGDGGKIFVAKMDGSVLLFQNDLVSKIGSIGEPPSGMVFENGLWVAGTNSIFLLGSDGLKAVTSRSSDSILGFKPFIDRKNVIVVTSTGVRSLPLTL